ncbi:MAG: NUDIX domain-containing protein [Anaerolineae bacterium]|jgi:8-oxo-dGTP pyrophosphatase MutT (NUDIX family)|nr:NUDIX domain-containing protein [Anaerolineae bacterium]
MPEDAEHYPDLFRETLWPWGPQRVQFARCTVPPHPVAHVNLIPFTPAGWVILRVAPGAWSMPGGTLEPGESIEAALRREVLEEAGADILHFRPFGAWHCHSLAAQPYRPHVPHPEFYRLVCVGEVRLVSAPARLPGAEDVLAVDVVPLPEIERRFLAEDRPEMAQLYRLAADLR